MLHLDLLAYVILSVFKSDFPSTFTDQFEHFLRVDIIFVDFNIDLTVESLNLCLHVHCLG